MMTKLCAALLGMLAVVSVAAADRPTTTVNGKIYPIYDVETEAKPVKRVSPVPMGSGRMAGQGGEVTVGAVVDEKGNVRKTYIVEAEATGDIRAAIVNAVKASKFPVIKDPVSQRAISYVVMVKNGLYVAPDQAPTISPKLADIIFNPKYFRGALGRKALILSDPITGAPSPELLADVKSASLPEDLQLIPLPKDAIQPMPKSRGVAVYPDELRRKNIGGKVRFVYVVGADGGVKGIYCASASHPDLAIAAAASLVRWRFEPAKIQNTPVPVIVGQVMEFEAN